MFDKVGVHGTGYDRHLTQLVSMVQAMSRPLTGLVSMVQAMSRPLTQLVSIVRL